MPLSFRSFNSRRCAWLCAIVVTCASFTAGAAPTATALNDFSTRYVISRNGFEIGEYRANLDIVEGARSVYATHTRTIGMLAWFYKDEVIERSEWTAHKESVRPLAYSYLHKGGRKERAVELVFDWSRGMVENTIGGDSWKMSIPAHTLDKLVVQLALMLDLQNGKKRVEYTIADGGKLKTYRFKIVGEERLETPAGAFDTVKIERVRDDNKRATFLWCAPKLNYLPVRIDQREEDDSKYRMVLQEYNGGNGSAAVR